MGAFDKIKIDAGHSLTTIEDLVIPIDYDDVGGGSVGDPPIGSVFRIQDDIDNMLSNNGWTAFKHLAAAYEALPYYIAHNITFNLATGVHRPRATDTTAAWPLTSKQCVGGNFTINGSPPSAWDLVDPSLEDLSISSMQVASGNPYVSFAGTPFLGLNLKGWFAVFNTGQVTTIHDHDDSTLYVNKVLSPVPTTVSIMTPSTILKNSLDDITKVATNYVLDINPLSRDYNFVGSIFNVNYLTLVNYGAYSAIIGTEGSHIWTNILVNREIDAPIANGGSYAASNTYVLFMSDCSHRAIGADTDSVISVYKSNIASLSGCYGIRGQDGVNFYDVEIGGMGNCVFENVGNAIGEAIDWSCVVLQDVKEFEFNEYNEGKRNEIRSGSNGISGLRIERSRLRGFFGSRVIFKNIPGPCVRIWSDTHIEVTGTVIGSGNLAGFVDGGGNLDVGIQFEGGHSSCKLESGTDVTGSNGDVKLFGGEVVSYTTIETDGPLTDEGLDLIEKI